jgi:hypothetical protein
MSEEGAADSFGKEGVKEKGKERGAGRSHVEEKEGKREQDQELVIEMSPVSFDRRCRLQVM